MTTEFSSMDALPREPAAELELEPAALLDTKLRVWAEIGRTHLPAATGVGMSEGAILDLDRESDEPADLYVNGRHFGTGRLILVDGEWALRIESLDPDRELGDEQDAVEQASNPGQDETDASD